MMLLKHLAEKMLGVIQIVRFPEFKTHHAQYIHLYSQYNLLKLKQFFLKLEQEQSHQSVLATPSTLAAILQLIAQESKQLVGTTNTPYIQALLILVKKLEGLNGEDWPGKLQESSAESWNHITKVTAEFNRACTDLVIRDFDDSNHANEIFIVEKLIYGSITTLPQMIHFMQAELSRLEWKLFIELLPRNRLAQLLLNKDDFFPHWENVFFAKNPPILIPEFKNHARAATVCLAIAYQVFRPQEGNYKSYTATAAAPLVRGLAWFGSFVPESLMTDKQVLPIILSSQQKLLACKIFISFLTSDSDLTEYNLDCWIEESLSTKNYLTAAECKLALYSGDLSKIVKWLMPDISPHLTNAPQVMQYDRHSLRANGN